MSALRVIVNGECVVKIDFAPFADQKHFKDYKMNLGTYLKSEIIVFVPGLNSNVWFCVVKID